MHEKDWFCFQVSTEAAHALLCVSLVRRILRGSSSFRLQRTQAAYPPLFPFIFSLAFSPCLKEERGRPEDILVWARGVSRSPVGFSCPSVTFLSVSHFSFSRHFLSVSRPYSLVSAD